MSAKKIEQCRTVDVYDLMREIGLAETEVVRGCKDASHNAKETAKAMAAGIWECEYVFPLMMQLFRKWAEENGDKWEDIGKPLDVKA